MPENDKIHVNLGMDSSYVELAEKIKAMAKKAKETGNVINAFGQEFEAWGPMEHPASKLTRFLAQAAANLWGKDRVTWEWQEDYKTLIHVVRIIARIHPAHKPADFTMKFTEEFFGNDEHNKQQFFIILNEMCHTMDVKVPVAYSLTPKGGWSSTVLDDIMMAGFTQTTSSYEYLGHVGVLAQLDWYWDNPEMPFPQKLAFAGGFHAKKDFWIKDIPEGDTLTEWIKPEFQIGGFFPTGDSYGDSGTLLKTICPGMTSLVNLPCNCSSAGKISTTVEKAIIHLNDTTSHADDGKEWTRDEIADWLESLDVDLSIVDNSDNTEKEN